MIAPQSEFYPNSQDDVLPALREYLEMCPQATTNEPQTIAWALFIFAFTEHWPSVAEVETALEALTVEGEVLP